MLPTSKVRLSQTALAKYTESFQHQGSVPTEECVQVLCLYLRRLAHQESAARLWNGSLWLRLAFILQDLFGTDPLMVLKG